MTTFSHRARAGWLLALAGFSGGAAAAPVPPPGIAEPQLKREQLRQERSLEQSEQRADEREIPALMGEPPPDQPLPASDEKFVLQRIQFSVSRFLPAQKLEEIAAGYLGKPISFADLGQMLHSVNALYEEKGVVTARAVVPPQKLAEGTLKVALVEARLDKVLWLKDPERVDKNFFVDRVPLARGEILDTPALTDAIRRLNDTTPGPQLSASLAKGDEFGTTQVQLEAVEPEAFGWQVFGNNYGSDSSGRNQIGASVLWFSPTGHADVLSGTAVKSDGTVYGNVRYGYPINRYNGVLYLDISRNQLEIRRGPYASLNIRGDADAEELGYRHPFWINGEWMVTGSAAWSRNNSRTTIEGVPLSEVRSDDWRLGALVQYRTERTYVTYDQSVTRAEQDNLVTDSTSSATLLNGSLFGQHRIGEPWRVVAHGSWQHADRIKDLPSTLLYQLGGSGSVRGYEPGIVAGPRGWSIGVEGWWSATPEWELGVVEDYGVALDVGTKNVSLSSLGVAASYQWKRMTVSAVLAYPKERVTPDQDPNRLWVQVSIQ